MADEQRRTWGKATQHITVLFAALVVGVWLIGKYGYPRFGDPQVCSGIGFGCSPNEEADALGVMFVLFFGLVLTGFSRRLVPVRFAWHMTAIGIAISAGVTGVAWQGAIIRYGEPSITVAEGRAEADRLLAAVRAAVGPATAFAAEEEGHVAAIPSPAELVAALATADAEACLDRNDKDTGTSRFVWSFERDVFVPQGELPAAHVEQLRRVAAALEALGYTASNPNDHPARRSISLTKAAPPLRTTDYIPPGDFSFGMSLGLIDAPNPAESRALLNVYLRTPCLREGD